jgi:multidrug efflux pump subunit AcrA (membrane-fusion protein)
MAAHQAFIKDPVIAAAIGQNPQAKQIQAAVQAHIAEHLGFSYRKSIEDKLGVPLPPPDSELPEEIEVNLARMIATGGKELQQENQQKAAQKQAQEQAKDPIFQLQQQEMQVKQQEVQRKAQKDQLDAQAKQAEAQRKVMKDQTDAQLAQQKLQLETQLAQMEAQIEQAKLELDERKTGAKMAADRRKDNTKLDLDLLNIENASRQKGDN